MEMTKIKLKMSKPVYLGLSLLQISKTIMYEFWYAYIKPKYPNNAKLCFMDIDRFIIQIQTKDVYKDIADDVEKDLTHQITELKDACQKVKKYYCINEE